MSDTFFRFIMAAIFLAIAVVLVWVGVLVFLDVTSEKFTLTKAEWTCTHTEQRRRLTMIGKVMVPRNVDVCMIYERIK